MIKITKAKIYEAKEIHKLVNYYANQNEMLPRSLNELYENIREFFVAKDENVIIGCAALHISWDDLAEVKALAVEPQYCGKGIGKQLADHCLKEAEDLGVKKVFALTFKPDFFLKLGFQRIDKESLPHKVWNECINCPKFPDCDEIAVVKTVGKQ